MGLEFAYFYQAFGAKVTVIELEQQMLPGCDAEVAEELRRAFLKRKVEVLSGHGYKSAARRGDRWIVTLDHGGQSKTVEAELVLVAVAAYPTVKAWAWTGSESNSNGADSSKSTMPHHPHESVYAIGDVIRPPLLAHKASGEGIAAVEIMAGEREPGFDLTNVPACVYCEPEVATIGMTEAAAKAAGIEVRLAQFSLLRQRQGGRRQSCRRLRKAGGRQEIW